MTGFRIARLTRNRTTAPACAAVIAAAFAVAIVLMGSAPARAGCWSGCAGYGGYAYPYVQSYVVAPPPVVVQPVPVVVPVYPAPVYAPPPCCNIWDRLFNGCCAAPAYLAVEPPAAELRPGFIGNDIYARPVPRHVRHHGYYSYRRAYRRRVVYGRSGPRDRAGRFTVRPSQPDAPPPRKVLEPPH